MFRHECIYLAARDASTGELVGVLPSVRVRSLVFGHFLVSMPFLNYGGPLGSDEAVRSAHGRGRGNRQTNRCRAARTAKSRSATDRASRSRIGSSPSFAISSRIADALFASLPAKLRSQIKRPRKEGVRFASARTRSARFIECSRSTCAISEPRRSRARCSTPSPTCFPTTPISPSHIISETPDRVRLWFRVEWRIRDHLGVGAAFAQRDLAEHARSTGSSWRAWGSRASSLFNFGRCTKDSGTYRFKMQWGGREEQLWWYQLISATERDG